MSHRSYLLLSPRRVGRTNTALAIGGALLVAALLLVPQEGAVAQADISQDRMDSAQREALNQQQGQTESAPDLFLAGPARAADLAAEQQDFLEALRAEPTSQKVRVVRVDVAALREERVRLQASEQQSFTAVRSSSLETGDDYTWIGELAERPGQAVLVVKGDQVTGNIRANGDLYQLRPIGGGLHALYKVDQDAFPEQHPPEFEEIERQSSAREFEQRAADPTTAAEQQQRELHILVAYTNAVAARVADVDALIALAIAENNLANRNSGVNIQIKLVDSYRTTYTEHRSFVTNVTRFRNNGDGHMDEVHSRRDQSGADMAVLIMNNGQYCGYASAILANEATAFAGVHYTCATGNYTFAHELGHLQGARHNPEQDGSTTPFAYGHGYQDPQGDFRTVMAYRRGCPSPCPRVPHWSSDTERYQGQATGTSSTHDNARVLNNTASLVTNFRSPPLVGVLGYAWANRPRRSSYRPSLAYAHNSAGGDIRITRSGRGRYAVRFQGMGGQGRAGGNVQVTPYGYSSHNCKVGSWWSGSADFVVNVRCFDKAGNATDTYYSVLVRWP